MGLFAFAEISEIAQKAIEAGLGPRRESLLFAFSHAFVAALPGWYGNPGDALRLDLNELNQLDQPVGGEIPLSVWLRNAAAMSLTRPELAKYFDAMALKAVERAARAGTQATAPMAGQAPGGGPLVIPQKVLFRNTLLPDSFVTLAAERAKSVARLSVPAYEGGQARLLPSGNPGGVYGTCWLIGSSHLVTNWHVITARADGEPAPADDDLALQVANTRVEFDYVRRDMQVQPLTGAKLVHRNPALDFVVLELPQPVARAPLPLATTAPQASEAVPMAANIIQHPAGEPRQFGIRDNLVAVVQGTDLAYFTDTAGGSSGSPVCDDQWRVIALHKASSAQFGNFSFQGKSTAWVNVGTLVGAIVDDLKTNQPALWTAIGAQVAV